MQLTALEAALFGGAWRELDRHLTRADPAPVVVALSGGGDSVALLRVAAAWCGQAGRPLLAITIDHRLQAASEGWARWCAALCARLGVAHEVRAWEGPWPATGIAAAARKARHRLLASVAREAGARVILLGHTADDIREAALMRVEGATTPSPRCWSTSPAWPEGRGLFLLRPLLGLRRGDLREVLRGAGQAWIDDPANDDQTNLRARMRLGLCGRTSTLESSATSEAPGPAPFAVGPAGELTTSAPALLDGGESRTRAWLAAGLACASGQERLPRRRGLDRLVAAVGRGAPFAATLGGAVVSLDAAGRLILARETSDRRAGPVVAVSLAAGAQEVWDGRFEFCAACEGLQASWLSGRMAGLDGADARRVRGLHPLARRALPVAQDGQGALICPTLRPSALLVAQCLVGGRLAAAVGLIGDEAALAGGLGPG